MPRSSLWNLFELVRDYELDELPKFERPPHILDLGAHAGAFSLLALAWWPGATIDAYEPHPFLCDLLRRNVAGEAVEVHERAVLGDSDLERLSLGSLWVPLFEGRRTLLGSSCVDIGWQRTEESPLRVKAISASLLPMCQVLKIDVEGVEAGILDSYPHVPHMVMCELHGADSIVQADRRFSDDWGLKLLRRTPGRGGTRTEVWGRL
jgi:FkbM family methyltransferase